jgi:hypothetical protein
MKPVWPQGFEGVFMIGIDDIHPESSLDGCDCGGDVEGGVLDMIEGFMKKYPKVPVTLYVTPNWMYKPIQGRFKSVMNFMVRRSSPFDSASKLLQRECWDEPYRIDREEHAAWRAKLKDLVRRYRMTIGVHGLTHVGQQPPYPDEFLHLRYNESLSRLRLAKQIFAQALPTDNGFLPPAYGVNAELIKALDNERFEYVISTEGRHSETFNKTMNERGILKLPAHYPALITKGLVNLPRNWNLGRSSSERAMNILHIGGIVSVYGHICGLYHGQKLKDPVTLENLDKLGKIVDQLERKPVWFAPASEIATHWKDEAKI